MVPLSRSTERLRWLWLLVAGALLAACQAVPAADPVRTGVPVDATGIVGQVTDAAGEPAASSVVYAYRTARGGLRGPADFEARVDATGRYWLDLVEGEYHLVARRRLGGGDAGPPRPGDAWALAPKNPVKVVAGQLSEVDFVLQGIAQPMLMREGTLTSGDTGFAGRLVDAGGQPLAGAFVIAYPEPDFRHMPEATSPSVGADGQFELYVGRPGQWCLAARTKTRGQPAAGELYGVLGEGAAACRTIRSGEILNVGAIQLTPYQR